MIPVLLVVAVLAGFLWARSTYDRIEKVDLTDVLDPVRGDVRNYLLVGSDSRERVRPRGRSRV